MKLYLNHDEQKVLITKRLRGMLEEDKKTPLKSFHALWNFAEDQIDKNELKVLLLTKNSSNFTIFHETIIEGDEKTFNFMVEVHERILTKEELKELITRTFQSNKTLLFKSMGVSVESILMLWDYLQDIFDDDEDFLKKFLSHRDDFGDTAFSSMKWYDAMPNEVFMPFIAENFSKNEREKLFMKIDLSDENDGEKEVSEKSSLKKQNSNGSEEVKKKKKKKGILFHLNCFCCKN
jgi:hypothetical protein